jgi:hypothetical protein
VLTDELVHERGKTIIVILRRAIFDIDILPLDEPNLLEAPAEPIDEEHLGR